jgi:glycine cleavage system transcriptional repressor
MQHVILTAIGADRPGLVDEVSQFIFDRSGSIEDSRMVNLRGQFAMMVLLGGSDETIARIEAELMELQRSSGLHAELRAATAHAAGSSAAALPYRLTATAIDQPGLVHRLAHVLRSRNVNIESLDTRLTSAPITGSPMFEMELVVSIPGSTSVAKLREELGKVCDELNIDFELKAA